MLVLLLALYDREYTMIRILFIALISLMTACCPLKGDKGDQGVTGHAGKDASCTVTNIAASEILPNGGAKLSCSDGTNVLVSNGAKGNTGASGATGAAGNPGSVFTSMQFCPGTTTYPSTFIEVGFCINNTLYAVYSANDGFLVVIPPGAYSSHGIGSTCNFTVSANCVISH